MLETEVQDFCFVDMQLIFDYGCYLSGRKSFKFWCLHQTLSCCLSLSCVWSTILCSSYRPKMGTKLSDMRKCTSRCIHHIQLCHDEGTLRSKWPLTTG